MSEVASATCYNYDSQTDQKVPSDQFPDLCQPCGTIRVVLHDNRMPESAIGSKEHVQVDQNHDDTGAMHDMYMYACIGEAAEYAEQHPVARCQQHNNAEPDPDEEALEYLYP